MSAKFVKQSLLLASVITVSAAFLGRLLGYAREATLAAFFGTNAELDIFIVAFTIPEIFSFLFFAAIPSALLPLIQNKFDLSDFNERKSFWDGLTTVFLFLLFISAVIFTFKTYLIDLIAPSLDYQSTQQAIHLVSVLSWIILIRGMDAYFRTWLHVRKHFILPAITPILINITVILVIVLFQKTLGIKVLVYGWLIGSLIAMLSNGFLAVKWIRPKNSGEQSCFTVKLILLSIFLIGIIELIQLTFPLIDRSLATRYLGEGEIAALRYAMFLILLPSGVFVVTYSTTSFPWLADLNNEAKKHQMHDLYIKSFRMISFFMAFASVVVLVFNTELTSIAFRRGAFDANSLELTQSPFLFYAVGILFHSVQIFQNRVYFANSLRVRIGMILLGTLLIKVIGSYLLIDRMGHNGLALSTSIAWFFGFLIVTYDLNRILKLNRLTELSFYLIRIIFSAVLIGLSWKYLLKDWLVTANPSLFFEIFSLSIKLILGFIMYCLLLFLFKIKEPLEIYQKLKKKLFLSK